VIALGKKNKAIHHEFRGLRDFSNDSYESLFSVRSVYPLDARVFFWGDGGGDSVEEMSRYLMSDICDKTGIMVFRNMEWEG